MTTSSRIERWDVAPAIVEEMEAKWWAKHSWLEDKFAWVHPVEVRSKLRRHYLEKIVRALPPNGTIVDFGCGPGWLSILLAQAGAGHVVGVDNAPAQIAMAKAQADEAGVSDRVSFCDSIDDEAVASADGLIIHGVLHHQSWSQLDGICAMLNARLKPGARIFILEPVQGDRRYGLWALPLKALRLVSKIRRQSGQEREIRTMLENRGVGFRYPGYGVAPKEMPFGVGELEGRLSRHFEVAAPQVVLFQSVRVVHELLLWRESNPVLGGFLLRWLVPLYCAWERVSFAMAPKSLWRGWVFCLWEARVRHRRDAMA